jgi:ABC-type Zn2+ transport system substrate-binding protein/surface adhesin
MGSGALCYDCEVEIETEENHRKEIAKAREEQREACMDAVYDADSNYGCDCWYAVKNASLDATPLADRIRELEAQHLRDQDELGKLDAELLVMHARHKAELRRVAEAVLELCDKTLREDTDYSCMNPFPFPCLRTLNLDAILGGGE